VHFHAYPLSPEPLRFSFASRCPSLVNERKKCARACVCRRETCWKWGSGENFFFLIFWEEAAGGGWKGEKERSPKESKRKGKETEKGSIFTRVRYQRTARVVMYSLKRYKVSCDTRIGHLGTHDRSYDFSSPHCSNKYARA